MRAWTDGELADLIDEFSEGKIQFGFLKIKDPNTGLPKMVLIAWCGEGVPERTKGYFTSHLATVSKFLQVSQHPGRARSPRSDLVQGYHVQITARSDRDLTPEGILQKVSDASGAKYSSSDAPPAPAAAPAKPPVATKPVFTPSRTGAFSTPAPAPPKRTVAPKVEATDDDGWGPDAPPVTRTELEKVPSAYQPTKVDIKQLASQKPAEPKFKSPELKERTDVVKGGYQPVGKVDIAEIRRQAAEKGEKVDDKPEPVKGAYEPVGKVDIAALRARAQPSARSPSPPSVPESSQPKSVSERSAAFQSAERLTSLPKPKVTNRFAGNQTFTGTKAPLPGDTVAPKTTPSTVGRTSRTFADEGGKTPAQLWAERKAKERGTPVSSTVSSSPMQTQTPSGEGGWKSSYTGRTWAPVQTTHTGVSSSSSAAQQQESAREEPEPQPEPTPSVSSIRDRFAAPQPSADSAPPPPPPVDTSNKPNAGRDVPVPGLTSAEEEPEREIKQPVPDPPQQPRSPTPPTPQRESSPIRVAVPVSRTAPEENVQDAHEEINGPPQPLPIRSMAEAAPKEEELEEPAHDPARATAEAITHKAGEGSSIRAIAQYDYDRAEDNEIDLREGETITDIQMVDDDWWLGVNSKGEQGLFPSNYVELVESQPSGVAAHQQHEQRETAPTSQQADEPHAPAARGPTATALYDYEAAEENEISFPEGAKIVNIVSEPPVSFFPPSD